RGRRWRTRNGSRESRRRKSIAMTRRILLSALLSAALIYAQRGGGGGRGSRNSGSDVPMGRFSQSRLDRVAAALGLKKDEKKDIKTTFDEAQKEAMPLHDQLSKARLTVGEAVAGGKSQDDIAKAGAAVGQLEAQMAEIEIKAFLKVLDGLENDQKQRGVQMLFPMMRGLFAGKNWNEAQWSHQREGANRSTGRAPDFQRGGDEDELGHARRGQSLQVQALHDVNPAFDEQVAVYRHGRVGRLLEGHGVRAGGE